MDSDTPASPKEEARSSNPSQDTIYGALALRLELCQVVQATKELKAQSPASRNSDLKGTGDKPTEVDRTKSSSVLSKRSQAESGLRSNSGKR